MDTKQYALEFLKVVASMAVPYIALLKTRTDLDRYIATQRARESGKSFDTQVRRRWYHKLWRQKRFDGEDFPL